MAFSETYSTQHALFKPTHGWERELDKSELWEQLH